MFFCESCEIFKNRYFIKQLRWVLIKQQNIYTTNSRLISLMPCWMSSKLTLSWQRPLSYRNQSIDLFCKSKDWFLYDKDLRHERVKKIDTSSCTFSFLQSAILQKDTNRTGSKYSSNNKDNKEDWWLQFSSSSSASIHDFELIRRTWFRIY